TERTRQPENAHKVRLRSLERLGIIPSKSESDLHWQISNYRYRPDKRSADDASRWFNKILERNLTHHVYDPNTLKKYLDSRIVEIRSLLPRKTGRLTAFVNGLARRFQ